MRTVSEMLDTARREIGYRVDGGAGLAVRDQNSGERRMRMELTEIAKVLIELVAAIASLWLVPWLRAKLNAEQVSDMLRWVEIAVSAAEQLYDAAQGNVKKAFVLNFLRDKGYDIDEGEIDNAIEAAVLRLHKEITA